MKTDADCPRTLIVNAQFSEQSGSGTFLGRLFSSWPVDRLATVAGDPRALDWQRCRRHYRTGDREFRLRAPFNRLVPARRSGSMAPPSTTSTPAASTSPRASLIRRLARYPWHALLKLLGGAEILYSVGPSPQLLAWIREFQPEVLYGHCSDLNSVRFLRRMYRELSLPLVVHCMDDFPEALYRKGWRSTLLRTRYLAEFAELIRSADVVVAICQEMAEEYENRYQRPVLWLPMPVELCAYQSASRTRWTAARPFHIQYGGRVGWAIRECLADIAQVVHVLRQEGMDLVFDIVTPQTGEVPLICRSSGGVNVYPLRPLAELPRLQAEADLLLVCYDFDQESFRQARYSMPAKLAACMASGTPILVYGPAGLPVVEYARREGWGRVVDRRDLVALRAAVRELMDSVTLRQQLGSTAQKLARERHDANMVSSRLREILESTIRNTPRGPLDQAAEHNRVREVLLNAKDNNQ